MPLVLGGASLAIMSATAAAKQPDGKQPGKPEHASCELNSHGNKIKHVVHLQFDNVHLRRDNPNVPSDLEIGRAHV